MEREDQKKKKASVVLGSFWAFCTFRAIDFSLGPSSRLGYLQLSES